MNAKAILGLLALGAAALTLRGRQRLIDWRAVEKEWAGVEIIPYQDGLRLGSDVTWYYPWDAASGCIWDLTAITAIQHVGTMPALPAND